MVPKNKIVIIGHRGASKIAPENTIKAFKKAIHLGADCVEFDVQETLDNELVIIHDYDTLRTTGVEGLVQEMTLDELRKLNFGDNETIPTLAELIKLTKGKISLNCEIKVENIGKRVLGTFQDYKVIDSVFISSFLHQELIKIQKIDSNVKLATLVPVEPSLLSEWSYKKNVIDFTYENKFYAINPLFKLADEKFVEYAHAKGLKVFPWTVNSGIAMKRLINLGVDGIITNDISRLKEVLSRV
jgi:glycerophosphoryl diester phosphodiesterase